MRRTTIEIDLGVHGRQLTRAEVADALEHVAKSLREFRCSARVIAGPISSLGRGSWRVNDAAEES